MGRRTSGAMKKQAPNHVDREPNQSEGAPAMPTGAVAGEFVTETFDYDGGRQVTVYVPPDPPEAIVFAGDGQMISQWGGLLEAADVPDLDRRRAPCGRRDAAAPRVFAGFRSGTVCRAREVFRRGRR